MIPMSVVLCDVGDGLHMLLGPAFGGLRAMIDCGCGQRSTAAYESLIRFKESPVGPFLRVLVLSHFHADHYKGLLDYAIMHRGLRGFGFHEVYYPMLPKFPEAATLFKTIQFINRLLIGEVSGSPQYDFIDLVGLINDHGFSYRPLSKGDSFYVEGQRIAVLWPPRTIQDGDFTGRVRNAIKLFDEALTSKPEIMDAYERFRVNVEGIFEPGQRSYPYDRQRMEEVLASGKEPQELDSDMAHAVDAIIGVANSLSIVLKADDSLLFMGDLEQPEIEQVIEILKAEYRFNHTQLLIPPHHGTHWHERMLDIFAAKIMISAGKGMSNFFKRELLTITNVCNSTYTSGTIEANPWICPQYTPLWM